MTQQMDGIDATDFNLLENPALLAICRSVAEVVTVTSRQPSRVRVALGSATVEIEWPAPPAPGAAARPDAAGSADPPAAVAIEPEQLGLPVPAPLIGTFYQAAGPGQPPFVRVGDLVEVGQQIGIVEAMKLMNPVESPYQGRVIAILVGDGEPVEYGQHLICVEPSPEDAR